MRRAVLTLILLLSLGTPHFARAFSVAPPAIDLSGAPGEVVETTVRIINTDTIDRTYYLDAVRFQARSEGEGIPSFLPDATGDIEDWVMVPQNINIPSGMQMDVPVRIAIPADASAGGHYAAVVVSDAPSEVVSSNGATLSAKAAVLLFLAVEGNTVSRAALLDVVVNERVDQIEKIAFVYRVQNQGDTHVVLSGTARIVDWAGRTVTETDANTGGIRILPAQTREFSGRFADSDTFTFVDRAAYQFRHFAIGPARVEVRLTYDDGQILNGSTDVWILPLEAIVVLSGGCILLALLLAGVAKASRRTRS